MNSDYLCIITCFI